MADRLNVLVVDDDEVDRKAVRRALQGSEPPVQLQEAATAGDGLRLARANGVDAILLDYMLPDMDGLQVLRQLRSEGVRAPIVMLTGFGSEDVAVQAMKSGASDYLAKDSLNGPRLLQTLRNAVARHRLEGEVVRLSDTVALRERMAVVGVLAGTALDAIRDGVDEVRGWREAHASQAPAKAVADLEESLGSLRDVADILDSQRRLLFGGPRLAPVALHEIVGRVLAVHGRAVPPRIELTKDLAPTPAVPLDPEAVRQILLRLLSNAVEAIPEKGRIRIATRSEDDHVELSVEDEGSGVPREAVPRLFDLFATTKEGHEGIGLPLVKHLAAVQGGAVTYRPAPTKGSRFTVSFPRPDGAKA